MKSKTLWYILLGCMLVSSALINLFGVFLGIILFGLFSYMAGAYHIKFRLEDDINEWFF